LKTTIIYDADEYLSTQYSMIEQETNLLKKYRPTYEKIEKSSLDAIESLENYLEKPQRYFGILGKINVVEFWQQAINQNFELFSSKFSYSFGQFCKDNGFGHETRNGVAIPERLGLIFMTILAHNIGDRNNFSTMTDISEQRGLSPIHQSSWKYNREIEKLKAVKKLIELTIPKNIDSISVEEIIESRETWSIS
jgi:hypothetical protein